jgi:hypothetical protein
LWPNIIVSVCAFRRPAIREANHHPRVSLLVQTA